MKKFPKRKSKGKLGIAFVEEIVFTEGSIFREVPEDTDIGIDGYIEFVDNENATGILVGVQIKTGYVEKRKDGNIFRISFSNDDINYFNVLQAPVALIVYDPNTKSSAWLNLKEYIRCNQSILNEKNISIRLSNKENPFTVESFTNSFKPTFQQYKLVSNQLKLNLNDQEQTSDEFFALNNTTLLDLANEVASSELKKKFQGLVGLLNHKYLRFSPYTCFLLISHLFHEDEFIRSFATDTLSRYLPHPESGFAAPGRIINYIQNALTEFRCEQVKELLKTGWLDEESKFGRGSLGQSAGIIIINIPNYERYLYQLAVDPKESYEVRTAAIGLPLEFGFFHVLEPMVANFDQIEWGDILETAKIALEAFAEVEGTVDDQTVVEEYNLIEIIKQESYDSNSLGEVLLDAAFSFLLNNQNTIEKIWLTTNNSYVRIAASRAVNRIMEYRNPPRVSLQKSDT